MPVPHQGVVRLEVDRPRYRFAKQFHPPTALKPADSLVDGKRQAQIVTALAAHRTSEIDLFHYVYPHRIR